MTTESSSTSAVGPQAMPHTCYGTSVCSITCEVCGEFLADTQDGQDAIAIVLQARNWLEVNWLKVNGLVPSDPATGSGSTLSAHEIGFAMWNILSGSELTKAEFDVTEHFHGIGKSRGHTHAWGTTAHSHMLRALCSEPECVGCDYHNIHASPKG